MLFTLIRAFFTLIRALFVLIRAPHHGVLVLNEVQHGVHGGVGQLREVPEEASDEAGSELLLPRRALGCLDDALEGLRMLQGGGREGGMAVAMRSYA